MKSRVFGKPFQKGQSGNAAGRPRGSSGIAAYIRKRTKDFKELVDKMLSIAENGKDKDRIDAIAWLADRGLGKVIATQNVNLTGTQQPNPTQVIPFKQAQ